MMRHEAQPDLNKDEKTPDEESPLLGQRDHVPFGVPLYGLKVMLVVILVACISVLCFKTSLRSLLPSVESNPGSGSASPEPKMLLPARVAQKIVPNVLRRASADVTPQVSNEPAASPRESNEPPSGAQESNMPVAQPTESQQNRDISSSSPSKKAHKLSKAAVKHLYERAVVAATGLRMAVNQEMEARGIEKHAQEVDPPFLMSQLHALTEHFLFNDEVILEDASKDQDAFVIPIVGIMTEKFADHHAQDMIAKSNVTSWSSDSWVDHDKNLWRRIKVCRGKPEVCKTEQTVIKNGEEVLAKELSKVKTPGFVPALRAMVHEIMQLKEKLPLKTLRAAVNHLFARFVGCPMFPTEDASPFPAMLDNPGANAQPGGETSQQNDMDDDSGSSDDEDLTDEPMPSIRGMPGIGGFQGIDTAINQLLRNMTFMGQGHSQMQGRSTSIVSQSYVGRDGKVHTEESETFLGKDGKTHQKVKKCVDKKCKTTENEKATDEEALLQKIDSPLEESQWLTAGTDKGSDFSAPTLFATVNDIKL